LADSKLRSFLPAKSKRVHLMRLIGELAAATPLRDRDNKGLAEAIHEVARRVHKKSLMVILSDFLADPDQIIEALHHLHYRGHDLIAFQVLDWSEAEFPFDHVSMFEDPETGRSIVAQPDAIRDGYKQALQEFTERLRDQTADIRADFVQVDTSMTFDRALIQFLIDRQRRC
jgi:hypothetical protein